MHYLQFNLIPFSTVYSPAEDFTNSEISLKEITDSLLNDKPNPNFLILTNFIEALVSEIPLHSWLLWDHFLPAPLFWDCNGSL